MAYAEQTFSVGQIYTAGSANQTEENIKQVRKCHKGTSAPPELTAGVLWLDDSAEPWVLKMYDGTDWIPLFDIDPDENEATPTTPGVSDGTGAGAGGSLKNALINGNMQIWQRGTSFASPADAAPVADGWNWRKSGSGVVTIDRDTKSSGNDDAPAGSTYSMEVLVTTNDGAIGSTDYYAVEARIEGLLAARFKLGTAAARPMALSFWAKCSRMGTYCVALQNTARDRSYVATFTVAAADTWERHEVLIVAGDTSGTWSVGTDIGLRLMFVLAAGTNYQTTAGAWTAGDKIASSAQENLMDQVGRSLRIAQVQLEIGETASEFEARSFAEDWILAQRYYAKTFPYSVTPAQAAGLNGALFEIGSGSSGRVIKTWYFPVAMRATPTIVTYNPSVAGTGWRNIDNPVNRVAEVYQTNENSVVVRVTYADGNSAYGGHSHGIHISADAAL